MCVTEATLLIHIIHTYSYLFSPSAHRNHDFRRKRKTTQPLHHKGDQRGTNKLSDLHNNYV